MAHITGGGFVEKVPRALPVSLGARIDVARWALPPVFRWVMRAGEIVPGEMVRIFNCGIKVASNVAQGRRKRRKYEARFAERGFTQIYTSHQARVLGHTDLCGVLTGKLDNDEDICMQAPRGYENERSTRCSCCTSRFTG